MKTQMHDVECTYCKSPAKKVFTTRDYNRKIDASKFCHYKCPECGLYFITPIPEDLGKYYASDYYITPDQDFLDRVAVPHEQYKMNMVLERKKSGKLLEIGPSYGCFTYMAKNAGFEVSAIEMDERCSVYLRDFIKVNVINSSNTEESLEQLPNQDVIALWHVIEHLTDPWSVVKKIAEKLRPGGILILAAPNPNAFQFKLMGKLWPHVDAPRHLYLIPQKNLIKLAEDSGLRTILNTTRDEGSLGWNKFGWEQYFTNFSRWTFGKKILRRVGRFFYRLFKFHEDKEGHGAAYTLIFQKSEL